ncbi:MRG/MORF4L-binding protein-like [Artemia franciscana]
MPVAWTAEQELQLFSSLTGSKPMGVMKHFQMACILEKLSSDHNFDLCSDDVWKHLEALYNLPLIEELEPFPFQNIEMEFSLNQEFQSLMEEKPKHHKGRKSEKHIVDTEKKDDSRASTPSSTKTERSDTSSEVKGKRTRAATNTPTRNSPQPKRKRLR